MKKGSYILCSFKISIRSWDTGRSSELIRGKVSNKILLRYISQFIEVLLNIMTSFFRLSYIGRIQSQETEFVWSTQISYGGGTNIPRIGTTILTMPTSDLGVGEKGTHSTLRPLSDVHHLGLGQWWIPPGDVRPGGFMAGSRVSTPSVAILLDRIFRTRPFHYFLTLLQTFRPLSGKGEGRGGR